jgi:hypothetical protein
MDSPLVPPRHHASTALQDTPVSMVSKWSVVLNSTLVPLPLSAPPVSLGAAPLQAAPSAHVTGTTTASTGSQQSHHAARAQWEVLRYQVAPSAPVRTGISVLTDSRTALCHALPVLLGAIVLWGRNCPVISVSLINFPGQKDSV